MTTIMTWETSGGKKGRCDGRCHNATHPKCVCVCGGRLHSSAHRPGGVEQAVKDTWEEAIQEAEAKAKAEGMELNTSRLRKFIGLEPANPAKADNLSNPGPTVREVEEVYRTESWANLGTCRGWKTIKKANQETGVQGQLPLEVT